MKLWNGRSVFCFSTTALFAMSLLVAPYLSASEDHSAAPAKDAKTTSDGVIPWEQAVKEQGWERPKDFNPIKHISERFEVGPEHFQSVAPQEDGTIIVRMTPAAGGAIIRIPKGTQLIEPIRGKLPPRRPVAP